MIDIFQIYVIKMTDTQTTANTVDTPTQPVVEPKASTASLQFKTQLPEIKERAATPKAITPAQTEVTNGSITSVRAQLMDLKSKIYNIQTSLIELRYAIQAQTINKGIVTQRLMSIAIALDSYNTSLNVINTQINTLLY